MRMRRPGIGTGFGRLWAGSTTGNLGDGISRIAIALFAVGLTRDPFAVAVITALSYLPGLVLGLPIGALVDRYDRRRLAMLAGGLRAAGFGILMVAAATDRASLWLLYAVVVLLYTCETGYDHALSAMIPMVVADRDHLERANGRLQGSRQIAESFLGPPLAGMLFAIAAVLAFGAGVACFLTAVVLLVTLPGSFHARGGRATASPRASMGREIRDGLRYLRGHPLHRSLLALMAAVYFGAAMVNATNVLWTLDVLGVSERWFGVFVLTMAGGALAGSQTAAGLARRAGRGPALWIALATCGVGGLVAAATTSPYVAGAGLVLVGWASMAFGVVTASLRQRLTPTTLLGRVTGSYWAVVLGAMVLGAVTGGGLAAVGGLRLPWLVLGVGLLAVSAVAARRLTRTAVDRATAAADAAAGADAR
jgi:MFS family permease